MATSAFAKDVYLAIGGSVGNFRTDTRIFNPSQTKDIQIQAYLLPASVTGLDNSNVQPKTITVPKRSMVEYDDVVSSLFGASGLGGIRLSSSDDFVATQRVYSTAPDGSTNGQFVAGVDASNALKNGVIIQMKSNSAFRTNRGMVNPNNVPANVTWYLYDKNNNVVGQPIVQTLPPFAVLNPTLVSVGGADLSDMWLAFVSDQPVIAYGSVIDNKNSAGTYVAAAPDTTATTGSETDLYLSIGGSVGTFRTDMRIFNPSSTKDIQIQAYLLATGNKDNSAVQPKTITVAKRSMAVYDDVVSSLFGSTGLGGIRLSSSDNFIATQRVYSTAADGSTNGQFVAAVNETTAMKNGVVIQMKSNSAFHTNVGVLNPNTTTANVTWRLYDRNNNLVGQPFTQAMPPLAVIQPSAIAAFQNTGSPSADLTDSWVTFSSDQPILAYGSVIDNLNSAGTYVAGALDSGGIPAAPPTPTGKTYQVTEQSYRITISPSIGPSDLKPGDLVNFTITVHDADHGFELLDPNGTPLIPFSLFHNGDVIKETFTVTDNGTYTYFCVNTSCGTATQHAAMVGQFDVGMPSDGGGPHYKH